MQVLFDSGPPTHVDMFTGMPLWECELDTITVYSSFCDVRFSSAPFHVERFDPKLVLVIIGAGQLVKLCSTDTNPLQNLMPRSPYCPSKGVYGEVVLNADETLVSIIDNVSGSSIRPFYGVGILQSDAYYKERAVRYVSSKLKGADTAARNRLLRIIRVLDKEEWGS